MKSVLIVPMLLFLSCTNVSRDVKQNLCFLDKFSQKIEKISLKDIDKIKSLNGQFIQVEGYLTFEFENVALYPYKWSEPDKSLWLNFSDSIIKHIEELRAINYKEITVIGKVNILHKGHYSGYLAELDSVFCIKEK